MSFEGGSFYKPSERVPKVPMGESLGSNDQQGIKALNTDMSQMGDAGTDAVRDTKNLLGGRRISSMGIDEGSVEARVTPSGEGIGDSGTDRWDDAGLDSDQPMETAILEQRAIVVGDMSDPKDWEEKVLAQIDFKGNRETAAILLTRFAASRREFEEMLQNAGSDIVLPQVSIFRQEEHLPEDSGVIAYAEWETEDGSKCREVMIKQTFLETMSASAPDQTFQFPVGSSTVEASAAVYMELTGVEEHHHAIFHQVVPESEGADYGDALWRDDSAVAEYHTTEVEWQALNYKLDYAQRKDIHGDLVEKYKDIEYDAARLRASRGLPTHKVDVLTQQPMDIESDK
jgi:hypothetical protein